MDDQPYLGPLRDGARVAIVGGGPGGCAVALALARLAGRDKRLFDIYLYEPKSFDRHYNQCLGVLSPPLLQMLRDEFDIALPDSMFQRRISGYVLHGGGEAIRLEEEGETYAVRRLEFDRFMLSAVAEAGIVVYPSRVTGIELRPDGATVFSEGEYLDADVVFCCFGLDPGMTLGLKKESFYKEPRRLETLVTKYECSREVVQDQFESCVQAFLPAIEGVEFAAITPKSEHCSVVVAGRRVRIEMLEHFLALAEVRPFLPPGFELGKVYRGYFPCSPASNFFDDRFVAVGDAAGLMRPFKGKGINSAVITGVLAARTAVLRGISKRAFRAYVQQCSFLIKDYFYGRLARRAAYLLSHTIGLGPVIRFAARNEDFRWALTKSISGGATYKEIVLKCMRPSVAAGLMWSLMSWPFR